MKWRRSLALALAAAVVLVGVANVAADRKANDKEQRAIARVVEVPRKCVKARISTETERPKWASAAWRPGPGCQRFAFDGVAVLKKKKRGDRPARWRFVTAGSSFQCADLYRDVPRPVAKDLGIDCG
ncbi:MAG: hypothetical protein ACRDLO_10095 [Solirubrobacterales bacterium]